MVTRQEIAQGVQEIFRDILAKPELVLNDALTAPEVKGWDSFTHINLITAIERHYRIRIGLSELDQLKNVGDILTLIEKKTQQ